MAHKHGDPIPTPNRPDQTPAEQRPEVALKPHAGAQCESWNGGIQHGPHGTCPGFDRDWEGQAYVRD